MISTTELEQLLDKALREVDNINELQAHQQTTGEAIRYGHANSFCEGRVQGLKEAIEVSLANERLP